MQSICELREADWSIFWGDNNTNLERWLLQTLAMRLIITNYEARRDEEEFVGP